MRQHWLIAFWFLLSSYGYAMDVANWIHTSDMGYTDSTVYSHTIKRVIDHEGTLYVATTDHTVHRWTGEIWEQIGETLLYEINDLTSYKGQLLVATYSATGDSILTWNGMAWVHFGPYLSGKVHDLLPYNETLYVGGDSEMGNLLYLVGETSWHSLKRSKWRHEAVVTALGSFSGNLVVGGNSFIGNFRFWNGTDWWAFDGDHESILELINQFKEYNIEHNNMYTRMKLFGNPQTEKVDTVISIQSCAESVLITSAGKYIFQCDSNFNCTDISDYVQGSFASSIVSHERFILAGNFSHNDEIQSQLVTWNGTHWDGMVDLIPENNENLPIQVLYNWNNTLYIGDSIFVSQPIAMFSTDITPMTSRPSQMMQSNMLQTSGPDDVDFTSSNTFTISEMVIADVLVVGGGGGGSRGTPNVGGGGGGGGGVSVAESVVLMPGIYTIQVGAGGDYGGTCCGQGYHGKTGGTSYFCNDDLTIDVKAYGGEGGTYTSNQDLAIGQGGIGTFGIGGIGGDGSGCFDEVESTRHGSDGPLTSWGRYSGGGGGAGKVIGWSWRNQGIGGDRGGGRGGDRYADSGQDNTGGGGGGGGCHSTRTTVGGYGGSGFVALMLSNVPFSPSPSALPSASPFVRNTKKELRSFETVETRADRVIVRRNGHNPRSVEMDREKGSIVVSTNSNAMNISLLSIEELSSNGSILQTFLNDDSLRFSTMTQEVVDMGTAEAFRMSQTAIIQGQSPMPGAGARVTTEVYSFQTNGSFSYGTSVMNVSQHDTKIIIRVEFWDFMDEGEHLRVTMQSQNNLFEPTQTSSEDGRDTTLVWGPHVIHLSDQTQTDDTFQVMFEHYPKINIVDRTMQFMLNRGQQMEFDPLFTEGDVETDYQLFEKASENHLGDPICPSGFELRRVSGDETDWMPGFDTTDDLPFCTRVYDTEQEICLGDTTFVTQATTEYNNVMYYGCAGLTTTCCAYPKPSNCGSGGHCPKSLNGGELCQVPWTNLCNNRGSCRDNQCVCEHGFVGDSCANAPACDTELDYEVWIPISNCYPLCGTNRTQMEKKRPKDDKYWCPTLSREATCVDGNDLPCDSLTKLTDIYWETVDFNSLVGFVGESNEIGDIVSLLISQDEYGGRLVFTGNDTLAEAIEGYRNHLGMLPLVTTGSSVRDHLNDLYQFMGDDGSLEFTLTQFLLEINETIDGNRNDSSLRDLISGSEEIVYSVDVPENLVKSIKELTDRLGESPIEEFGDIDTLRTLILLSETKVGWNQTDKCEYYDAPLRPKGCTGHCGTGSRTIRWVPKPNQPSYCTVIHVEEDCQLSRACPQAIFHGEMFGDVSCQYTDWTKWSGCQTSGQKGDVQGWQGRSRDLFMGVMDQCVDTFEYQPCNVTSGERLMMSYDLFLQHTIQTYQSSGENVVIMSVVLLSLSVILGVTLISRTYWSEQLHLQ